MPADGWHAGHWLGRRNGRGGRRSSLPVTASAADMVAIAESAMPSLATLRMAGRYYQLAASRRTNSQRLRLARAGAAVAPSGFTPKASPQRPPSATEVAAPRISSDGQSRTKASNRQPPSSPVEEAVICVNMPHLADGRSSFTTAVLRGNDRQAGNDRDRTGTPVAGMLLGHVVESSARMARKRSKFAQQPVPKRGENDPRSASQMPVAEVTKTAAVSIAS